MTLRESQVQAGGRSSCHITRTLLTKTQLKIWKPTTTHTGNFLTSILGFCLPKKPPWLQPRQLPQTTTSSTSTATPATPAEDEEETGASWLFPVIRTVTTSTISTIQHRATIWASRAWDVVSTGGSTSSRSAWFKLFSPTKQKVWGRCRFGLGPKCPVWQLWETYQLRFQLMVIK